MSLRTPLACLLPTVLSALVLPPRVARAETAWFALPGPHFTYRVCCGGGDRKVRFGGELSVVHGGLNSPFVGGFLQVTPVGPGGGPLVALGAQANVFFGAEAGLAFWGEGEGSAGGAGFFLTPHASIGLGFFGVRFTFPGASVDGSTPAADIDLVWAGKIPIPIGGSSYGDLFGSIGGGGRPIIVEGELVLSDLRLGDSWGCEAPAVSQGHAGNAMAMLRERLVAVVTA